MNDQQKEKIETDYMYSMYKFEATHVYPVSEEIHKAFPKVYIDYEIRRFKKDRVNLINDILDINATILNGFLASLNPEYKRAIAKYEHNATL